jgi:predicted amidohydrolase YtcJ
MKIQVLYNALIYTQNPDLPVASALAVRRDREDGVILAVGTDDSLLAEFGEGNSCQDMGGRVLIPGLCDAHIHLLHYALGLRKIDCEVPSKAECLQRVQARAAATPPGEWILGHGWNQNEWPEGFGSADDLDAVAPHHPVYLTAKSLHSAWANHAALRLAGITASTPNPQGGIIQRNVNGEPTGILLESAAERVASAIPVTTPADHRESLLQAQERLLKMGITAVHDFDGQECFSALQELRHQGVLQLRVLKSIPHQSLSAAVELGLQTGFGDDRLRIGAVKMFSDGALGPHTAAMFAPYENDPDNRGMLMMDAEEIYQEGLLAVTHGLSLAIHAIGDRANHEVLAGLELLKPLQPGLRHRIEHVQLLRPQDTGRLAALGIIASMQPIHATSDMYMADAYWGKRSAYAYALQTQVAAGAALAFGSDAPVDSPNPFWGLHAAVTRQKADGSPGPLGWYPEQRLSVSQAIQGFTRGAAYAAGMEDRLGVIMPGYRADLIVLERDPYHCPPADLRSLLPTATMVGAQWVFNAP